MFKFIDKLLVSSGFSCYILLYIVIIIIWRKIVVVIFFVISSSPILASLMANGMNYAIIIVLNILNITAILHSVDSTKLS